MFCQYHNLSRDGFVVYRLGHGLALEPHPPAVYRLHVSRSFTVFYIIETDENVIKIEKIMTIERAHKEYSRR